MKYICLRDCYVNDRFHRQGETYELPDAMRKSPKNFQLVEESEPEPEKAAPTPKTKPAVIPKGMFWCDKHQTLHKLTSSLGKKCLKRIEAERERVEQAEGEGK